MKKLACKISQQGFSFFALLLLSLSLQGCSIVSGVVAVSAATSAEEHSAYTDYLFAAMAHNQSLTQQGQQIEPILSEQTWLNEVYKPKSAYAYYYDSNRNLSNNIIPFEIWEKTEYPKFLEQQKLKQGNARNTGASY
jgi:hypothetical protein